MTKNLDSIRLQQEQNLKTICRKIQITEMVTVYFFDHSKKHDHEIYCALIPNAKVKECLGNVKWDLPYNNGSPAVNIHYKDGVEVPTYYRYGLNQGIEPLIFDRNFDGMRPNYKEINEEFRFFHNLFHNTKENKYIKICDDGNEEVVAVVEENKIEIRLKEIRQFLAIKEMSLAIQFNYKEYSQQQLLHLDLSSSDNKEVHNESECWALSFVDGTYNYKSISGLRGKKIIAPLPKSKSGMWGFTREDRDHQYVDFIINVDDHGNNIMHPANPNKLLSGPSKDNTKTPHYLTPIHFKKTVLDKYRQPSGFSVEDSYLRCGDLWGLQIDNHHSDKVCVWLGDLGELPYEEQMYWRSHNIAPVGDMSEVYLKRQILAEFTDSNQKDHIFTRLYHSLNDACDKKLTWQLLRPLNQEDLHHLSSIRIPATDEQIEFDELILSLTKILVDSLNEEKLNKFIPAEDRPNIKGSIDRLEKVLQVLNINDYEEHIGFLRKLQNLRSSGVAHRKGSSYQKIANDFGIMSSPLKAVFEEILRKANDLLVFLGKVVKDGAFNSQESGK